MGKLGGKKPTSGDRTLTDEERKMILRALEKFGEAKPEEIERMAKKFGRGATQVFWFASLHLKTTKQIGLLLQMIESLEHRIEHIEQKLATPP